VAGDPAGAGGAGWVVEESGAAPGVDGAEFPAGFWTERICKPGRTSGGDVDGDADFDWSGGESGP
jgi:hypothetical protein